MFFFLYKQKKTWEKKNFTIIFPIHYFVCAIIFINKKRKSEETYKRRNLPYRHSLAANRPTRRNVYAFLSEAHRWRAALHRHLNWIKFYYLNIKVNFFIFCQRTSKNMYLYCCLWIIHNNCELWSWMINITKQFNKYYLNFAICLSNKKIFKIIKMYQRNIIISKFIQCFESISQVWGKCGKNKAGYSIV